MNQFTELVAISAVRPDGGVSIRRIPIRSSEQCYSPDVAANLGFTLNDGVWSREITDELIEADLKISVPGGWVSWRRIEESDLPDHGPGRVFRNALRDDGKTLGHDMGHAREIVRQEIRAIRPPQFASLDNAMKPLEVKAALGTLSADEKLAMTGLEAQRQALRDAPADPAIDAAKSISELATLVAS